MLPPYVFLIGCTILLKTTLASKLALPSSFSPFRAAWLLLHPKLFSEIPNGAYVVITLSDDKKFNAESLSLIKDRRRKKIVEAHKSGAAWSVRALRLATAA